MCAAPGYIGLRRCPATGPHWRCNRHMVAASAFTDKACCTGRDMVAAAHVAADPFHGRIFLHDGTLGIEVIRIAASFRQMNIGLWHRHCKDFHDPTYSACCHTGAGCPSMVHIGQLFRHNERVFGTAPCSWRSCGNMPAADRGFGSVWMNKNVPHHTAPCRAANLMIRYWARTFHGKIFSPVPDAVGVHRHVGR